ncbi:MAG TPA: MFS transporter [Bacillota bacterium]|nr:MFS transporter [Bacillota bacterium]
MKKLVSMVKELRSFLILWSTQSFSALGSAMTGFALIIWSYQQEGSALTTALLSVCTYAPYVLMSIFAGALSDKWNKRVTMLICDTIAALTTVAVLILLLTNTLQIWHLYCINAVNGFMNTVQKPAADVTISLLTPQKHYQKVSGLQSFSNSLITILTPMIATPVLALLGIKAVIFFDLFTFCFAFVSLLCFIKIPQIQTAKEKEESVLAATKAGLQYLKHNSGILHIILFFSLVNLTASIYNAALPAMLLSRNGGSETALGVINTVTGVTMLIGSVIASAAPAPKSRVRVICNALLISMSTENFFLAFGQSVPIWCIGAVLGWICIPIMNANMDVLFRSNIPIEMQGRVFAARNTLQFFTIPVGYFLGGILIDKVFEPFMAVQNPDGFMHMIFGIGKGSGAAVLFFVIAVFGALTCLIFRKDPHIWVLESKQNILSEPEVESNNW